MAFASTKTKVDVIGSHRVAYGTFSQASGDTGGTIATGLRTLENFQMTGALNATFSGGTVTVVTADPGAAQAGYWTAIGI